MDSHGRHTPSTAGDRGMDEVTFARFTTLALLLSTWAREHALQVPQYRSPPRVLGVTRTLRRAPGSRAVVSVQIRGRRRTEVVRDMVDGLFAVNPQPGPGLGTGPTLGPGAGRAVPASHDAAIAHLLTSSDVGRDPQGVRPGHTHHRSGLRKGGALAA